MTFKTSAGSLTATTMDSGVLWRTTANSPAIVSHLLLEMETMSNPKGRAYDRADGHDWRPLDRLLQEEA
jgi:hypothetical protein